MSRHNRPETLWTVNHLSRNVTKWSQADDKRLHRLIAFIHHNPECIQFGFVGDNLCDCYLTLFCDAGFAGDLQDSKSTGGWFLFLCGPRTRVPICWSCKKQGAVSHSSTEAEIITLEGGIRMDRIPAIMLFEKIMQVMYDKSPQALPKRTCLENGIYSILDHVDFVPQTCAPPTNLARMIVFEDNDRLLR